MAGIKFHGAIDVEISRNHIYRTCRGLWLDWMAQGTRVIGQPLPRQPSEDLFVEVDHGPFLVDNNLFLSPRTLLRRVAGRRLCPQPDRRRHGDERFRRPPDPLPQGALHRSRGTAQQPLRRRPLLQQPVRRPRRLEPLRCGAIAACGWTATCSSGAPSPPSTKKSPLVVADFDPALRLVEKADGFYLEIALDKAWPAADAQSGDHRLLGKAAIPNLPYEKPDGTPIRINTDYFGQKETGPIPCPARSRTWPGPVGSEGLVSLPGNHPA